jgi:very-short-patch-repair endonuclease
MIVECDQCKLIVERRFQAVWLAQPHHFCGRKCSALARKPGELNYATWMANRDLDAINTAREKTMLARYGARSSFEMVGFRERSMKTSLEHWGVEHPMMSAEVQRAQRDALIARHGVTNSYQVPSVVERSKATQLERYGAEHYMQSSEFKQLVQTLEFQRVRHQTMKLAGTHRTSRAEDACYDRLREAFGRVERQAYVGHKRWSIDFYVNDIDTYVQFDGVYWHGLDRALATIKEFRKPRDRAIYQKWATDREQDAWFAAHDLRLVRVTDKEFDSDPQACLLRIAGDRCPVSSSPHARST